MEQEQIRFRDQQLLQGFGPFGNPFSGIAKKPAKTEMEILRGKMMKRHDMLVKESNESKSLEVMAFKQKDVISQLQMILSTYGWSFGGK